MHDKFTDQTHKVLKQAEEEAQHFNSNYIGGEHILLALINDENGSAIWILQNMGVTGDKVRSAIDYITTRNSSPPVGTLALSPRAKKALDLAGAQAEALGHSYIGP